MKVEMNINRLQKAQPLLSAIMQRLCIHSMIVLACYHIICNVLLLNDGWLDVVFAIVWSGNAFWLPDYAKWFGTPSEGLKDVIQNKI